MTTTRVANSRPNVSHRSPKVNKPLGVVLAAVAGIAIAAQARINGQLGSELHDSMLAAVISFGGGLIVLTLALTLSARMRMGLRNLREAIRDGTLKRWHCLGGIGGAAFVASQSITVGAIGVALFTVGVVAGQTVSGLFVDRAGLGPAGPQALTSLRAFGALLTLAAVAGSLAGGLGVAGDQVWLFALPLLAGALMAAQQAVNGRVGAASNSAMTATLLNFVSGTTVLVLGWLVSLVLRGGPTAIPGNPGLYLGGLVGIVFIALASMVVKWTGVLLLGQAAISGQLIGAVLLDVLAPAPGEHLTTATLIGATVALAAVGIAAIPVKRDRDRAAGEAAAHDAR